MSKRCVILGGNGFIGKNLLEYLERSTDYTLTSFDRTIPKEKLKGVNYIKGDFTADRDLISAVTDQDIIIHLISTTNPRESMQNPYIGYNVDVIQTIKILEFIKGSDARILFSSSGGTVYGEPDKCPIPENHKLTPISHYGITKVTIENIINMYNTLYGMKNIIMRIANPYGPGQDYKKGTGIIDAIVRRTLNNQIVTVWGDGTNTRDYIYIDDLCMVIQKICDYDGKQCTFNIGSGKGADINNIISTVEKILNKKVDVEYKPAKINDIKHIYLNINRMKCELNFKPSVDIYDGVTRYINYINQNLDK